jgi:hypothetical protein
MAHSRMLSASLSLWKRPLAGPSSECPHCRVALSPQSGRNPGVKSGEGEGPPASGNRSKGNH